MRMSPSRLCRVLWKQVIVPLGTRQKMAVSWRIFFAWELNHVDSNQECSQLDANLLGVCTMLKAIPAFVHICILARVSTLACVWHSRHKQT